MPFWGIPLAPPVTDHSTILSADLQASVWPETCGLGTAAMPTKRGRRGHSTAATITNSATVPSLSQELWEHVFSFLLRVDRLPIMAQVCHTWNKSTLTDPDLWRFLVVTCEPMVGGKSPLLAPQRRLPQTYGEYTPSRTVLEGALPVTLEQLLHVPKPSLVETIVFARDWAALPDIKEEEAWFGVMQVCN